VERGIDDDDDSGNIRRASGNIRRNLGNLRRDSDGDDDDDNKPVWPTWAVGTLFRGARPIRINHVGFHIPPRNYLSRNILVMGRKHPY
jgi:hypothetical protein